MPCSPSPSTQISPGCYVLCFAIPPANMSDMENDDHGPPKKKTRSSTGTLNKKKFATTMTPAKRMLNFPKGIFCIREGVDGMWCTYCGVEVQTIHSNFGWSHINSDRHKGLLSRSSASSIFFVFSPPAVRNQGVWPICQSQAGG